MEKLAACKLALKFLGKAAGPVGVIFQIAAVGISVSNDQKRAEEAAAMRNREKANEEELKKLEAKQDKKWKKAEEVRKQEAAEQKQQQEAAEQMRKQEAAEFDRKLEAAEQMQRQDAAELKEQLEAAEQMQKQDAAEIKEQLEAAEQVRLHEAQQSQMREAEQELGRHELLEHVNLLTQETHAQRGLNRETTKLLKDLNNKIDRETLERREAIRMQDLKFDALVQKISDAFKLFMNYYHSDHRQSSPLEYGTNHSRSQPESLEYQERIRLLANLGLPQECDEDLQNVCRNSLLLLEDKPSSSFDMAESSKHPNFARGIVISTLPANFETDLLSMVMTTLNDRENPQVSNLMALQGISSSLVMTSMNNDGTRAKEEGDAYFKENKFKEAIEWYSKSIDELPTAAAYGDRAMAYIKINNFMEAEYDCTDALKIDDRYFEAYARRAMARTKLKFNLQGALDDVQAALNLESNDQAMHGLRAQIMSLKGNPAKGKGSAYYKLQNFERAIECYSSSITELPTAAAYGNRAMAYIKLNKFIEAENDCTEALKIDDRYFKAYARRAMARTKLGFNLQGALEDAQVALGLDSNNLEMENLYDQLMSLSKAATETKEKGNNYFRNQKFEDAIICYSASVDKFPTAIAYCNRAMAYMKLKKMTEVENDCTKALEIDSNYFKAYARRAIARVKLGHDNIEVLRDVNAALKLESDDQEMKQLHAQLI